MAIDDENLRSGTVLLTAPTLSNMPPNSRPASSATIYKEIVCQYVSGNIICIIDRKMNSLLCGDKEYNYSPLK